MRWGEADPGWYRAKKHLLDEVEQGIKVANRALISRQVPSLTRDSFLRLATVVASARADYLGAAVALGRGLDGVERLTALRVRYDEARLAFDALVRSISRGYVDIADTDDATAAIAEAQHHASLPR